ncbi:hypothetical protein Tco_0329387 [Tanacetum coccineum]
MVVGGVFEGFEWFLQGQKGGEVGGGYIFGAGGEVRRFGGKAGWLGVGGGGGEGDWVSWEGVVLGVLGKPWGWCVVIRRWLGLDGFDNGWFTELVGSCVVLGVVVWMLGGLLMVGMLLGVWVMFGVEGFGDGDVGIGVFVWVCGGDVGGCQGVLLIRVGDVFGDGVVCDVGDVAGGCWGYNVGG